MKDSIDRRAFFGRAAAAFLSLAAAWAGSKTVLKKTKDRRNDNLEIERTSRVPADYSRELAG
ncbi:MAG: hypothetical protein GF388_01375 [Candidatus Aegiribacteria sp.]|nr:hypothetical protein [Candidatus Aegiribacteria sp.]MBD3294029.1 hypothetical protein [Candidatus Fermentibacteria bacterium]